VGSLVPSLAGTLEHFYRISYERYRLERQSRGDYGGRHQVVHRGKAHLTKWVIVDEPEILQVRISIAQRAIEDDQDKEPFQVLMQMRRGGKRLEPLEDGSLV
jgi:hypothetical protein